MKPLHYLHFPSAKTISRLRKWLWIIIIKLLCCTRYSRYILYIYLYLRSCNNNGPLNIQHSHNFENRRKKRLNGNCCEWLVNPFKINYVHAAFLMHSEIPKDIRECIVWREKRPIYCLIFLVSCPCAICNIWQTFVVKLVPWIDFDFIAVDVLPSGGRDAERQKQKQLILITCRRMGDKC